MFNLYGVADGTALENFGEMTLTHADPVFLDLYDPNLSPYGIDTSLASGFFYDGEATDTDGVATPIASFSIANGTAVGSTVNISTAEMLAFVQDSADSLLTFVLVQTTDSGDKTKFASKEHATYAAPKLTLAGVPEPPQVDAGSDQVVVGSLSTLLEGTATNYDPNDTLTYLWTSSDPNATSFDPPNDPNTTVTFTDWGTYELTLTATNTAPLSASDSVSVTVLSPKIATDPNAPDGATGVDVAPTLSWTAGGGAISHDVWFGTDPDALVLVSDDQAGTTYAPGTLIKGQTYYWAVDEYDGTETHVGAVWSFTVVAPAADTSVWTNADPANNLWSSEANWDVGVPGIGSKFKIEGTGTCLIDSTVHAVADLNSSGIDKVAPADPNIPFDPNDNTAVDLWVTGGLLESNRIRLGTNGHSRVQIDGGTVDLKWGTGHLRVGVNNDCNAIVTMNGGTLNLAGDIGNASSIRTNSFFYLNGGVVTASNINPQAGAEGYSGLTMDISAGTLILAGDDRDALEGFIEAGRLIAYDGTGSVLVNVDDADPNAITTTVTACPLQLNADLTADCAVNIDDLQLVVQDWLYQTPSMVTWDGSTNPVTANIDHIADANDIAWSTTGASFAAIGKNAAFKTASSKYVGGPGTGTVTLSESQIAEVDPDLIRMRIRNIADPNDPSVPNFAGLVGFDTTAWPAADVLVAVSIGDAATARAAADFRWFVESAGSTYVSEIVATVSEAVDLSLDDATSLEWFNLDPAVNIDGAIGTSIGTGTLASLAFDDVDAVGFYFLKSGLIATGQIEPTQITSFSAVAVPPELVGLWDGRTGDSDGDVQPDGFVDLLDFAAIAQEWLLDGGI
ncbi:MAG: PKD domain-containing protein [Planctomycetota bacterium]|jgi:hypothetical protein